MEVLLWCIRIRISKLERLGYMEKSLIIMGENIVYSYRLKVSVVRPKFRYSSSSCQNQKRPKMHRKVFILTKLEQLEKDESEDFHEHCRTYSKQYPLRTVVNREVSYT